MLLESNLFEDIWIRHDIPSLKVGSGKFFDKLGDVYEDYFIALFEPDRIAKYNKILKGWATANSMDEEVACYVLTKASVSHIDSVEVPNVPKRESGGEPKTDVWVLINGEEHVKASIKQSKARAIAVAEFDVETIAKEVGFAHDTELVSLLERFQLDASAKNFTPEEKNRLRTLFAPYRRLFLNWVLSGSKEESSENPQHANLMVMFKTDGEGKPAGLGIETLSECVDYLTERTSGFGTGLSFTYATGSKSKKIQFKAPVITPQDSVVWV